MLVPFLLSLFFIRFKVRLIQNCNLSNFFYLCFSLNNYYICTHFSAVQESIIPDFFEASGQAKNIKLFAWVATIPWCYYLEIISIFAWLSVQNFDTSHASFQLFTGAILLEFKFKVFSFKCNDNLPFCFSWYFAKSWYCTRFFFWLWASIYCLLGDCYYCLDNFSTAISISCGFICCYYYYIWGDVWCRFQIPFRDATSFFSILYLSFGLLLSYPCAELLKLHHPDFVFGILIGSKKFVTTIQIVYTTGKSHIFTFAPYATIIDLRSQLNAKFRGIFESRFFLNNYLLFDMSCHQIWSANNIGILHWTEDLI